MKRQAAAEKATVRRTARKTTRKTRTAARKAAPKAARTAQERIETVTNNFFKGFDAVPAFAPFQNMFADANERGQDFAKRSQKVAEELADLARANVEAIVEAGRVASEGARCPRSGRRRRLAVTVSSRPRTRSVRSPKPSRRPSICSCRASSPALRSTAWSPRRRS